MTRAYNFNAGPAAIPLEVLEQAQAQFVDYEGAGMAIMEMSHRSAAYEKVNQEAQDLLREILNIPSNYKILFLQGGASTQFAMIPMNFLTEGKVGAYVDTGAWAGKAFKEASIVGQAVIAASTKEDKYMRMPSTSEIVIPENAAYVHITSNETIGGVQYQSFPEITDVPVIADMSSDILSRPIDVSKFGMIYAGAQKNLGPSGVTVVIVREDLVAESPKTIPSMFRYDTHVKANSLYNTPPSFGVYMVGLVLKWIKEQGGLKAIEQINLEKTKMIYDVIDESNGFYYGCANKEDRSTMNITFRIANEDLEKQFIKEADAAGFVGLKGHRDVGGLRASTYNAVPVESCEALVKFMKEFQARNA